jgi:hypothetical protein
MGVYITTSPLTYATLVLNEEFGCRVSSNFYSPVRKEEKEITLIIIQFHSVLYHLRACMTATRSITEKHKRNTKIQ